MRILERYRTSIETSKPHYPPQSLIIRLITKCLVASYQPYVCKQKHSADDPFLSKIMVTSSQERNLLLGGGERPNHERYSTPTPNSETPHRLSTHYMQAFHQTSAKESF